MDKMSELWKESSFKKEGESLTDFVRLRVAFSNYLHTVLGKPSEWMVADLLDIVMNIEKEVKV